MNQPLHWLNSPEWAHVVAALLHSLWQGAIVALVLAVLMRRLINPLTRYRCALSALGVIGITGIITWAVLNAPKSAPQQTPAMVMTPSAPETTAIAFDPNLAGQVVVIGQLTRPAARTNWTAWLAMTWLTGTMAMLLRAGIKVAGAEKLRNSCTPLTDEHITLLVAEACRAVGLARKIRVTVTDKLTSPAVVGVLVPTLILPLSLFTTLTPTQIQFVLLHELAHIRRGDYLTNLFQLFIEALLFFNPAVWWISHQIRREREACCDALAIELSGAPADYARTLVRVAENILQPAPTAASAFGDDGREPSTLADRVQRLLVPGYRPTLRLSWRAILAALFVGGGLLFLSALGTRVTVAAILSPGERIERIEKKMTEYGENLRPETSSENPNATKVEISGRVTTVDGSPLPKVKSVSIYYSRKNYSGADSARLQTNGMFSTKIQAGGSVAAALNEPNFAPVVAGPVLLNGTNAVTNLDLILDPGFDVPIFLTDAETGSPVVGALVKAQFGVPNMGFGFDFGRELKTDSTGVTTLAKCSASVELSLAVNAAGYEIADRRALRLNTNEPIRIQLKRGQTLSGVVLDKATATPLPDATVRMIYDKAQSGYRYQWTDSTRVLATTDVQGRFTATQLRRGTKYWLGISVPGHESALVGPVLAGAPDLSVQLGPELIVRGRVLGDLDGLQIINKDYCLSRNYSEVFDNHSNGFQEWVHLRVENGIATFQFTNPIPGLVTLTGGQGFYEEREITAPVDDWVIDLSKTQKVSAEDLPKREVIFRFTHPSGVLPRGTVSVSVPDSLDAKHRTAHNEIREITNGQVRVNITVGGQTQAEPNRTVGYWFKETSYFEVTNGTGPLVVEIPCMAAGAIYAKARNADGSPAGGLFFGIQEVKRAPNRPDVSLGSSDSTSGNEPRKWVSGPLPLGGTYQVYGWRGNSFCLSQPIKLTEKDPDAEVELQFALGKTIVGVLQSADGQPVRNAELQVNFSLTSGHGFGLKPILTDDRGEFLIEDAAPELGGYSVTAEPPGHMAEIVKLNAGARPQIIRLQRGRILGGQVVEAATGYVIPNVEVRAADMSTYKLPMLKTKTDGDGRFEFTTLGDVEYQFFVGDGQQFQNEKFRPDGRTNLLLKVKLYEWSKARPKQPITPPNAGQLPKTPSATNALSRLFENQLDDINFQRLSLREVVRELEDKTKQSDPEKLGVGFRIESPLALIDPATGLPIHTTTDELDSVIITFRYRISAPLKSILDQVVSCASKPIKYTFTNNTVRFSMRSATEAEPLFTREFTLPARTLYGKILTNLTQTEINRTASSNLAPIALEGFRTWLKGIGVNMDPKQGKSLFYKDRKGILLARATLAELDVIEIAIVNLNHPATALDSYTFQLEPTAIARAIETQFPQFKPVTATNVAAGLRALLESTGADLTPPKTIFYNDRAGGLFVRATPQELNAIEELLQVIGQQPPQVNIKVAFVEIPVGKSLPKELAKALAPITPENGTNFTSIIPTPQFKTLLRALEKSSAAKILAMPQVTTLSGRQAQLQVTDVKTIVSGMTAVVTSGKTNFLYQSQAMPFGPVLDVLPTVWSDGRTIQMSLTPTFTEFLGYEDAKKLKLSSPNDKGTLPLPIFRTRQMTTSASVRDGQTIVLGNFSDEMLTTPSYLNNSPKTPPRKQSKQLLVFVTPTIIDPAGNRLNPPK